MRKRYARIKCLRITRKYYLANLLGGACVYCGYNANLASLTFHHVHADEKHLEINGATLSDTPISLLKAEIKKCVLLCQNCHNAMHNAQMANANIAAMLTDMKANKITYAEAARKYLGLN